MLGVRQVSVRSFRKMLKSPVALYHSCGCSRLPQVSRGRSDVKLWLLKLEPVSCSPKQYYSESRRYEIVDDDDEDEPDSRGRTKNNPPINKASKLFTEVYSVNEREFMSLRFFNLVNTMFAITACASVVQILGMMPTHIINGAFVGEMVFRGLFLTLTMILCRTGRIFPTNVSVNSNTGQVKISYLYLFAFKNHVTQTASKVDFSYSSGKRCIIISVKNTLFDRFFLFYKNRTKIEMDKALKTIKQFQRDNK